MAFSEDEIVRRAIGQRLEEDARLIDAIVRQDNRQIRQLLQFGVNPNGHPMSLQGPPLHLAAQQGSLKCVQVLIDGGAYIDNPNGPYGPSGFRQVVTPLHVAVKHGNVGMVRLLTALGADIHIPDRDGITVRQLVNNRKDLQTVVESAIKERKGSWSQASVNFSDASRSSFRRGSDNSRYIAARLQLHDSCLSISRCASRTENHCLSPQHRVQPNKTALKNQGKNQDDEFDFVIKNNYNKTFQKSENAIYGEFGIQSNGWQDFSTQKFARNQKRDFGVKNFNGDRRESKDSTGMCPVLPYNECGNSSYNESSRLSSSSLSEFGSFREGNFRDFNLINSSFKSIEINSSRNQTLDKACYQQILQQKNCGARLQTNQVQSTKKSSAKKVRPFIPKLDLSKVNSSSDENEAEEQTDNKQKTPVKKGIKLFKRSNNFYSNYEESVLDLNDAEAKTEKKEKSPVKRETKLFKRSDNYYSSNEESVLDLNDDFNQPSQKVDVWRESDEDFRKSVDFEFERNFKKNNNNLHGKQDFGVFREDYANSSSFSQIKNNNNNNISKNFAYETGSFARNQDLRTLSEENDASSFRSCCSLTTSSSSTNTNTISFLACA